MSAAYNYERFDAYVESGEDEREFGAFPNLLHAGPRRRSGVRPGAGRLGRRRFQRVRAPEEVWAERARAVRSS